MVVVQSSSPYMMNLENLYHHFQELLMLERHNYLLQMQMPRFCPAVGGLSLCPVYPAEKKANHKIYQKSSFFVNEHQHKTELLDQIISSSFATNLQTCTPRDIDHPIFIMYALDNIIMPTHYQVHAICASIS